MEYQTTTIISTQYWLISRRFRTSSVLLYWVERELRSSGPFFKYSLINSAGAVLAFFLLSFLFLTKCGGSVCSISPTYWSQAYTIYAIYYVAYVYYITSALIQIASGVQIYLSIRQQLKWLSSISSYKVCLGFLGKKFNITYILLD